MNASTLRIAVRALGRQKGFTAVAVLSIGVAIALNTTMYSALDALLDPRIGARQPDRLYSFAYRGPRTRPPLHPDVVRKALREGLPGVEDMTVVSLWGSSYRLAENGPRYSRVEFDVVEPNYFDFLGSAPTQGRTFLPRDAGEANVVISDRLAEKLFPGRSPVGRAILLDGLGHTVIGVVKRNSAFRPLAHDVWGLRSQAAPFIRSMLIRFRERLEPHVIREQLNQNVAVRLAVEAGARPGEGDFVGGDFVLRRFEIKRFHWALIGAVVAVLLVACANLANLQLARGLARTRELALRSAVGASRRQIIGHLTLESALLAVAGLGLGVAMTLWGIRIVRATLPPQFGDMMIEPQTSWKMFVFATLAALVCLFLVGLLPALRISRVDPGELLKSGAGTGANRQHRRRYGLMVVAQIGFALPVLIGAIVLVQRTLVLHSREYIVHEMYGYDPAPLVSADVPFGTGSKQEHVVVRAGAVAAEIVSRAKSISGVIEATASISRVPARRKVTVDDVNGVVREEPAPLWSYTIVTPSYFTVYALPIVRGRNFSPGEASAEAVVVDEPTARFLWGNGDPIGRMIKFGDAASDLPWHRVVGVVGDLRDTFAIRRRVPTANYAMRDVYRVMTPEDTIVLRRPNNFGFARGQMSLVARVRGNTELAALRMERTLRTVSSADPATAVPLEYALAGWERERNEFAASLFSAFALIGIGLVAVGVFGIVTHSIEERRRELAVRISLGATARNVLHAILREGNVLILAGTAVGLLLIKPSIFWLSAFIDEESDPYNALLFAAIAAGLFALAVLAAYIPALRATRIDPVEALRHE